MKRSSLSICKKFAILAPDVTLEGMEIDGQEGDDEIHLKSDLFIFVLETIFL